MAATSGIPMPNTWYDKVTDKVKYRCYGCNKFGTLDETAELSGPKFRKDSEL